MPPTQRFRTVGEARSSASGQHAPIPRLIHLNGPPGVGKSTIAARLIDGLPLALLVDIDTIRVELGGWRDRPESKPLARSLGFALARHHLQAGHDVVLPQLIVRADVIDDLAQLARDAGAELVEVVLVASPSELRSRLAFVAGDAAHPRTAFSLDELVDQGHHAVGVLARIVSHRADAAVVDVTGMDVAGATDAVRAAVDAGR